MTTHCQFHNKEHDHYDWKLLDDFGWICKDALNEIEASIPEPEFRFSIGSGSKQNRLQHWADIKSRVTTHEGQLLSGKAGRDYQIKYSKKMLGTDMSRPADFSAPQYQKELMKTK